MHPNNIEYEWKITIIAQCTNYTLKFEFKELHDAIRSQLYSNKLRFVILKYIVPNDALNDTNTVGTTSVVEYYKGSVNNEEEKDLGPKDLYAKDTIRDFFENYVKPIHSKKHLLILWGHGAGLGFFPIPPDTDDDAPPLLSERFNLSNQSKSNENSSKLSNIAKLFSIFKANFSTTPSPISIKTAFQTKENELFETTKMDDFSKSFPVITAQQLADTINETGQKIDILLACNCYCQMFETGFPFANCVKTMVATQTYFPTTGYDYIKLFESLQITPSLSNKDITTGLFTYFTKKYDAFYKELLYLVHPEFKTKVNFDIVSISAINLSNYNQLASLINRLGKWLSDALDKKFDDGSLYLNTINDVRNTCGDLDLSLGNPHWIIDLTYFMMSLKTELEKRKAIDDEFMQIFDGLCLFRKDNVIAFLKPPAAFMFSPSTISHFTPPNPNYLSIFFPSNLSEVSHPEESIMHILYEMFYNDNATLSSSQQQIYDWVSFIRKYYNKTHLALLNSHIQK